MKANRKLCIDGSIWTVIPGYPQSFLDTPYPVRYWQNACAKKVAPLALTIAGSLLSCNLAIIPPRVCIGTPALTIAGSLEKILQGCTLEQLLEVCKSLEVWENTLFLKRWISQSKFRSSFTSQWECVISYCILIGPAPRDAPRDAPINQSILVMQTRTQTVMHLVFE